MELIVSTWRVTLASVVLLDIGDLVEAEPEITSSRKVETVSPLRAAFSVRIPRGNAAFALRFAKVVRCASHAAACVAKLQALAAAPTGAGDCLLAIDGSPTTGTLANACLAQGSPEASIQAHLLKIKYEILGGQLTVSTPTP